MGVVPRVRRGRRGVHLLFPLSGLLVGLGTWAVFHFVYGLGGPALAIGAGVGAGIFLGCEAIYTLIAAVLGWPHETRMSVREALKGLLSGGF